MVKPSKKFRYIYGPLHSWRLGCSLGIDPIGTHNKMCNFDCIYCQLGRTGCLVLERHEFVPTVKIIDELKAFPIGDVDYLTFSGRGEPTLAENLGCMIRSIRKVFPQRIAVITNSSLLDRKDVQADLALADFVMAKLDACSEKTFTCVDHASPSINFAAVIKGIKSFKKIFRGKLALQIMFVDENKKYVKQIADLARDIHPDEVQLNTPTRPSAVQPLSPNDMGFIKDHFRDLPVISVYDTELKKVPAVDERATRQRHGRY